jgi:hypothetical protein
LVFNLDTQAVVEAFYYDTFATMGVDLAAIEVSGASQDLSDRGAQLRGPCKGAWMRSRASPEACATQPNTSLRPQKKPGKRPVKWRWR